MIHPAPGQPGTDAWGDGVDAALAAFPAANLTGTVAAARLPATYAHRDHLATFIVADDGSGTHTTLGAAVAAITLPGTRILVKPVGGNYAINEAGTIVLPDLSNCTIEGWGQTAPIFYFPAGSSGLVFAGTVGLGGWTFKNFTLGGPGPADSGGGIGLSLNRASTCRVENVKLLTWPVGVRMTDGALHTFITNPYIASCGIGIDHIGGASGANNTHLYGGEIASCTTGIKGDSSTDGLQISGTSMESNTQAIDWNGSRSVLEPGRFEGNTMDTNFGADSDQNVLKTTFFNPAKHTDHAGPGCNLVEWGGTVVPPVNRYPELIQTIAPNSCNMLCPIDGTACAWFGLVIPKRARQVSGVTFGVGVAAGNVQVAVIDSSGAVLAKSVSTVMDNTVYIQTVPFVTPVWLSAGDRYRLVVALDDASATVMGSFYSALGAWNGPNFYANGLDRSHESKGGNLIPIGTSISGTSGDGHAIWMRAT